MKKFSSGGILLQAIGGLLFTLLKAFLLTSFFRDSHALDDLQWAVLFVSSGYTLLELFMAILARTQRFTYAKKDSEPLLQLFSAATTLPAERLAGKVGRLRLRTFRFISCLCARLFRAANSLCFVASRYTIATLLPPTGADSAPRSWFCCMALAAVPQRGATCSSCEAGGGAVLLHSTNRVARAVPTRRAWRAPR